MFTILDGAYLVDMMILDQTRQQYMMNSWQAILLSKNLRELHSRLTDMPLQHTNKLCKVAGCIIGNTRFKVTLGNWMLTCCDLSRFSEDAWKLAGLTSGRRSVQKDSTEVWMSRDEVDVKLLQKQLEHFNSFGCNTEELVFIIINLWSSPSLNQGWFHCDE